MINILNNTNIILLIVLSIGLISAYNISNLKYFSSFTVLDLTPINHPNLDFPLSKNNLIYVKIDDVIGYITLFLILSKVTNLSVEQMMFLPLGIIALPLGYFVFARYMLNPLYRKLSVLLVAILTLYIIFDSYIGIYYYSIFKYAFEYFLLFIFLLLYLTTSNNFSKLVLLLIFIIMSLIHYTIPFLTIIIVIIDYIINKRKQNNNSFGFLILLIIIFVLANLQVGISYFNEFDVGGLDKIERAISQIRSYIYGRVDEKYIVYESTNDITSFLKLVRSVSIVSPIIVGLVIYIIKRYKFTHREFVISIVIAAILHSVLYVNIGSISISSPTMILMFPLISLIIFRAIGLKEKLAMLYILFIFSTVIVAYVMQLNDINHTARYESTMNKRSDVINKVDLGISNDEKILTDDKMLGLYALESVKHGKIIMPTYFNNNIYESLTNSSPNTDYKYVILHLDNKPIESTDWNTYKPANVYINDINSNPYLDRIDNDGITVIYFNKSQ
ncbi:MAG: hypothetical protein QW776_03490 [Candidatus Nitrosocaldus sp.]